MEKEYKICQLNRVNKKTKEYMILKENIQIIIEILVAYGLYKVLVPKYIGVKGFLIISVVVILADIIEMVISIIRIKKNYYIYDLESKILEIYVKDFYAKDSFIPIKHIKCIMVSQNLFQKKYGLVDLVVSTGVSKYKIQGLSKEDGELIKNELGEIILRECYEK